MQSNLTKWSGNLVKYGVCLAAAAALGADTSRTALMVVAHGSREAGWNERVIKSVEAIPWDGPKGVAFLTSLSPEHALKNVAAQLDQPGVERIVMVPLLVSSYSGHYEEVRYYAGQRAEMPEAASRERRRRSR